MPLGQLVRCSDTFTVGRQADIVNASSLSMGVITRDQRGDAAAIIRGIGRWLEHATT
jgi:hypothetical protein